MNQAKKEQEEKTSAFSVVPVLDNPHTVSNTLPMKLMPVLKSSTDNQITQQVHSFEKANINVNDIDYKHVWKTSSTTKIPTKESDSDVSAPASHSTKPPTTTTTTTTTTARTTTKTTTIKASQSTVGFSPIPIETFPKLNLEDFVSPTSLIEKEETNEAQQKDSDVPILPFRTTLRTTTTTTTTPEPTTTTDGSPSGVITRLLSEAAAPIAGLSAATLAYSAAAMLPVWLPLAMGGRKKRSEPSDLIHNNVLQDLQKLDYLNR